MNEWGENRYFEAPGTRAMKAVVTTGNGGFDRLSYRDVPFPMPERGEVLVKVLAAGVNNTEINTRLGWYSSEVTGGTAEEVMTQEEAAIARGDGGWNKATPFPFIQGTDCCGTVVEGDGYGHLLGKRVLIRPCMRPWGFGSLEHFWMASDFDGAFAQYVKAPASEVFPVNSVWSDAELASIPCAYGTAENMLHRARLVAGETVLITGASGGVGSAAVQLALRRGAKVIAVAGRDKIAAIRDLGLTAVIARGEDPVAALGEESVSLVVDNVAGGDMGRLIKLLRRGGRYVSSGAIAGPIVTFDMRDFYLKDLTFIG